MNQGPNTRLISPNPSKSYRANEAISLLEWIVIEFSLDSSVGLVIKAEVKIPGKLSTERSPKVFETLFSIEA